MLQKILEHEHPIRLIDLQPNYPLYEEEYDDDDDDDDSGGGELITRQNFRCRRCDRCLQEINWFHRYYYECADSCDYSLHKFCGELPTTLKHTSHSHTLTLIRKRNPPFWWCALCRRYDASGLYHYSCLDLECDFRIDVNCAKESVADRLIYHPSHQHPLVAIIKPLLSDCNACSKEHKGIFYLCTTCMGIFIHSDCAFLPNKIMIQNATGDAFSHSHPLILSYSFPLDEIIAKFRPRCRVCNLHFFHDNTWIFKCDKCRYYVHFRCATSKGNEYRKLIKNYEDSDYPDLLHLPFADEGCSLQKHMFSKLVEHGTSEADGQGNIKHNFHPHPLILVHRECNDITSTPTSSKNNVLSCHNPMKKVQLLCNACVRPVTSVPFYKCLNDDCNFVLHEWCTQLPTHVENYPGHPEHTLFLHSNAPERFLSVFRCVVCLLKCNGFVYSCVQCDYHIDVTCSFIPQNITHEAHKGHLLSSPFKNPHLWPLRKGNFLNILECLICRGSMYSFAKHTFGCEPCGVALHVKCALFLPRQIRHKYDKHPMSLSYLPIENHKSDYFCEICENGLNPEGCFYHCYQCAQSVHSPCAPHILQSETASSDYYGHKGPYRFVNIKFGGIHKFRDLHPHHLLFAQGIESDGPCTECGCAVEYKLILKCQKCKFVIHFECCSRNWSNDEIFEISIHPLV